MFCGRSRERPSGLPFLVEIQSTLSKTDAFGTGTKCPS